MTSRSVLIPLPGTGPAALSVLDPAQKRLAYLPNASGSVTVKPTDFDRAAEITVRLVGKDQKPLDYARVELTDASGAVQARVLTPLDGGQVTFDNVAPGKMTVAADHGQQTASVSQDAVDTSGSPVITLVFATAQAELPVTGLPTATTGPRPHPMTPIGGSAPQSRGAGAADYLWPLLLFAVLAAGIWWLVSNPARLRELENGLRRLMGKEPLEEPVAAAQTAPARAGAAAAADPNLCPFCGARKDPATGACACSLVPAVGGAPAAAPIGSTSYSAGSRLVTLDGPARGQIFSLTGETTVGRDAGNGIALGSDTAVSRRHARFTASNGSVEVTDEGSSNGTFVNGTRITQQALQPADEIQIGHSRFRFEI